MSEQEPTIEIDYYSDILCVWAYAGQIRLDEVHSNYENQVRVNYRFLNIYGDVPTRIEEREGNARDPQRSYARKMHSVARRFDHTRMHEDAFTKVLPQSSNQAHLYLCALRRAVQHGLVDSSNDVLLGAVVRSLRNAFFERAEDVGQQTIVESVLEDAGVRLEPIRKLIENGEALAELSRDFQLKESAQIAGSPTYVFDAGREKLFGNVGYRIIEANINELLDVTAHGVRGATWC